MEFIQPLFLWGIGAVVIPVVIHFWHQKRGKTLAWAATRWLQERNQQQQRGIKLDNLLLLLLRCLMVMLLALILSQPILTGLTKPVAVAKIHLVQPEKVVVDNYRFELEEAIRKGEAVYWINAAIEVTDKPEQLPDQRVFNPDVLQSSINTASEKPSELHLYVLNNQQLANVPFIRVPAQFTLHTMVDSASRPVRPYLKLPGNGNVFVNASNQLVNSPVLSKGIRFQDVLAHSGRLTALVDFRDKTEQQTVLAALKALSDVYALGIQIDVKKDQKTGYDWVLTDQDVVAPAPQTIYVVSGKLNIPRVPNVVYWEEKLTPQTAERVRTGQLPEQLGELLIRHFNLKPNHFPLSQAQLNTLFVPTGERREKQPENLRNGLLLVFVGLIGLERWMALRQNA
ncbi:BatA domain-containing protein [Larkinella sp. GY13]|uniref:BatA domain-containing protein n=1 Tax=Larkinella sp. GY13 TaxID=3453720 RepID=UPI003EF03691